MKLTLKQQENLLNAEAKALATQSANDINVVPVSSVKIVDGKIWLINYFFEKTLENIKQDSHVALTYWSGLCGGQIKAKVEYITKGVRFDQATNWIAKIHPNRLVKGLLELDVTAIYDISIADKRI